MNNYVRQHMRDTAGLRGPKRGIKSVYLIDFIEFVLSLPGNHHKLLIYSNNYLQNSCKTAIVMLRQSTTHFRGFPSLYAGFRQLHATWANARRD